MVAAAVEKIVHAAQEACGDDDALRDLGAAATAVTQALHSLIQQVKEGVHTTEGSEWAHTHTHTHTRTHTHTHTHTKCVHQHMHLYAHLHVLTCIACTHTCSPPPPPPPPGAYDDAVEAILLATERLFASMGNAKEMVQQAMALSRATADLVKAIRLEAEQETDPDAQRRLLDAAKALADATARMVEAAKGAARNPNDEASQEAVRKAAENLRAVVNSVASSALKKRAIKKLEIAAKQTAAVCTQCIAAAQGERGCGCELVLHASTVPPHSCLLYRIVHVNIGNSLPSHPHTQVLVQPTATRRPRCS